MLNSEIEQICKECAGDKGWEPVPWPVGMWYGLCDVCQEEKRLCAPRDFIKNEQERKEKVW